MNISIIRADESRLENYKSIFTGCVLFEKYFSGEDGSKRLEASIKKSFKDKDCAFEAVDSHGETLGLICVEWEGMLGAFPYIHLLGVSSNARGMGVGTKLVEGVSATARAAGAGKLFLCVTEGNPRAKKLYTSLGFKKIGFVDDLFKRGVGENIMMKLL